MADVRGSQDVEVRGRYNLTTPALNDLDYTDLQLDSAGRLLVNNRSVSAEASIIKPTYLTSIGGWDQSASTNRLAEIVTKNSSNALITHDIVNRKTLELILLELLELNDKEKITQEVNVALTSESHYNVYRVLSLATTNSNSINIGITKIHGWFILNTSAAIRYVKLYDLGRAPIIGTDVPILTIGIPAGAAANVEFNRGIGTNFGLGVGITTGVADTDATSVAANDVVLNLLYLPVQY